MTRNRSQTPGRGRRQNLEITQRFELFLPGWYVGRCGEP